MSTEENSSSVESTEEVTWNNVIDDVSLDDYREESNETTESYEEPSEVDSSNEPVTEADDEEEYEYVIEVDGTEYTMDDIGAWKADSENKNAWSAKNTQTAQTLASNSNLIEAIANDPDLQNHLKDYFGDDTEKLNKLNLDSLGVVDGMTVEETEEVSQNTASPVDERLDFLSNEMREIAIDRRHQQIESDLEKLENEYPQLLGDDKSLEFLKFANDKGYGDVNSAFKEWSFPQMQKMLQDANELAKNKQRNEGKVINKSNGGTKGTVETKKYKSWNEINSKDPEIKKYFE